MLTSVKIRNFKSIKSIAFDLGRVNVLIGENGAGKSNVLEAIALAGAASAGKLDNEFLTSRGIRVTDPLLMRAAFSDDTETAPIEVAFTDSDHKKYPYRLDNDNAAYSQWKCHLEGDMDYDVNLSQLLSVLANDKMKGRKKKLESEIKLILDTIKYKMEKNPDEVKLSWNMVAVPVEFNLPHNSPIASVLKNENYRITNISKQLSKFIIYSPDNTSLRTFEREGQIEPLGINGEGLFKLLSVLFDTEKSEAIDNIRHGLGLFGWFKDFEVMKESSTSPGGIIVRDRFVDASDRVLDQKSVNEGFLFLLFYFTLFSNKLTPDFFAIDNIDASLNPKLCLRMISYLTELAKANSKQVIMTTHNPAILDGLNLDDDDQRLFVISRGATGHTRVRRIEKPRQATGAPPLRLSEAFLRGALGGLPKGF